MNERFIIYYSMHGIDSNTSHRSGSCRALAKYWSSFLSKKPLALCSNPSPIIELWALCAVPDQDRH